MPATQPAARFSAPLPQKTAAARLAGEVGPLPVEQVNVQPLLEVVQSIQMATPLSSGILVGNRRILLFCSSLLLSQCLRLSWHNENKSHNYLPAIYPDKTISGSQSLPGSII